MTSPAKFLVFDSGLGGLTVLREIALARPDADVVYVADDAFFPYGHHSEDEIVARVVPLIGDLIATHAPDLVVIACNTMSVSVMAPLRAAYDVPFVGTVPAIKPACAASKTKRVSVLGTKATVAREYTQTLIRDHAQACTVTLVGSPNLASMAEAAMAPWPVTWIDPAPAIARRVANLLPAAPGSPDGGAASITFTSGRRHPNNELFSPFFGGRIPA